MATTILPAFERYPKEAERIGRMIAGYGELEFEFNLCLAEALADHDAAIRVLFRIRGEDSRLQVADALMRAKYAALGLKDSYNTMLGAMRCCKSIRNQYAHCHWLHTFNDGLFFTDFDKPARTASGQLTLRFHHVDVPLLDQQEAYFVGTLEWQKFLRTEYHRLAAKASTPGRPVPTTLQKPPLYNPPDQHPLPPGLSSAYP